MSQPPSSTLDAATMIRRVLFLLVTLALALVHLFPLFRGLDSPVAMDQAQIAREVARGNGLTTKFIRPVEYRMAEEAAGGSVSFVQGFRDTMHAPLNPLLLGAVFKMVGVDASNAWKMQENGSMVFPLDRVVATVSTLLFLLSIGVSYLLVCRIFDPKIAGVTAVLMVFSGLFWEFATSGMSQMLLLFLFSCGLYFAYRAVEAAREQRLTMMPALLAGVCFCFMALTHWVTVWILMGYIIYAAVAFRPRGVVAIVLTGLFLLLAAWPLVEASRQTGSPLGVAGLTLQETLGDQAAGKIMRAESQQAYPLSLDGIVLRIARTTLVQLTDLLPFLGGIVVAPLFFVALLHPFKRPAIAAFRWLVLLMWALAAFGLAIYGISPKGLHPNQIHILFAPIMTAYGLAFISILWSRLNLPQNVPLLRNGHLIAVCLLSALPLVLAMPSKVRIGMVFGERGLPQWPPYYPAALDLAVKEWVPEDQVIVSDQPWAVAWYADRASIWLPVKLKAFERLEAVADDLETPFAGILVTPSSHGEYQLSQIPVIYEDFASLVMDGQIARATLPKPVMVFEADPDLQAVQRNYSYRAPLLGQDMIFYAAQPPRAR